MNRLYVGNLPYSTTEQDLRAHFGQHGELKDVKVVIDRETNRSKGFAFVEYLRTEDADAALSENGQDFGGRALRVSEALAKEGRGSSNGGNGGGGNTRSERPPQGRRDDHGGGSGGGRKRPRQRDRD